MYNFFFAGSVSQHEGRPGGDACLQGAHRAWAAQRATPASLHTAPDPVPERGGGRLLHHPEKSGQSQAISLTQSQAISHTQSNTLCLNMYHSVSTNLTHLVSSCLSHSVSICLSHRVSVCIINALSFKVSHTLTLICSVWSPHLFSLNSASHTHSQAVSLGLTCSVSTPVNYSVSICLTHFQYVSLTHSHTYYIKSR